MEPGRPRIQTLLGYPFMRRNLAAHIFKYWYVTAPIGRNLAAHIFKYCYVIPRDDGTWPPIIRKRRTHARARKRRTHARAILWWPETLVETWKPSRNPHKIKHKAHHKLLRGCHGYPTNPAKSASGDPMVPQRIPQEQKV